MLGKTLCLWPLADLVMSQWDDLQKYKFLKKFTCYIDDFFLENSDLRNFVEFWNAVLVWFTVKCWIDRTIRPVNSCQCCSPGQNLSTWLVSLSEHLGSAVCAVGCVIISVTLTFRPGDLSLCMSYCWRTSETNFSFFLAVLLPNKTLTSRKQFAKAQRETIKFGREGRRWRHLVWATHRQRRLHSFLGKLWGNDSVELFHLIVVYTASERMSGIYWVPMF